MKRRAWILAALLLTACRPQPSQWLVSVATDAPVPQFGDHLVLEVLGASASCTGCLRLIGVDGPDSFPVSFGVEPETPGGTVRVRVRLYRAAQAGADGLPPDGAALIDALGELPPPSGETRVSLNLFMSCFGVTSQQDQGLTCDPATGTLVPVPVLSDGAGPVAGSWPNAAPVACSGPVPDATACVPGGAFILGTPQPTYVADDTYQTQPEHLVQVDPFAMDIDEVSVGTVADLVSAHRIDFIPILKDTADPTSIQAACTYLPNPTAAERALPVNCVTQAQAQTICVALGKRLPREAEWEYAAGNLTRETQYPWGEGGDLCQQAILGRGRQNAEGDSSVDLVESADCRQTSSITWGPVAGGSPNDFTVPLGIRNLAGNMREWLLDSFAPYTDPCWQPQQGTLLVNPVCQNSSGAYSQRGSWWAGYALSASATARGANNAADPYGGFRCVTPM